MRDNREPVRYTLGPISYDLVLHWDRWEDPGDYPSGAGGCRLSSGPWGVVEVSGVVVVKLTPAIRWEMAFSESLEEWAEENLEQPAAEHGRLEWFCARRSGGQVWFGAGEFEQKD